MKGKIGVIDYDGKVPGRYHTACSFEEFEPWVKAQAEKQISLFDLN